MANAFEFLFDFAGPNGYLVHKVLPAFCARTGATATYVPVLLGGLMKATGNRPPWAVYADVPAKTAYDRLEFQRFIDANGLTRFKMNPHFPANSIAVMRGAIAAERMGVFMPYVEAMMTATWEEGINIGDSDAVKARLDAVGLDGAGLIAMTDTPEVKAGLIANTEAAVARGAFGIPTFFVGDAMFFGKERLAQVEAALNPA
jgi:2-hydroxychromene-2-carboxylate isomerase